MSGTGKKQVNSSLSESLRGNKQSRWGNRQIWVSIILLFLVLEIAVLSVERARWITPQPSLTLVLVFSIAVAWYLARSRLPGIVTHIIALVVGIGITAWQTYQLSASETVGFAIFLSFITWVMGYFSTWYILRRNNSWVAVCIGTLIVIVNLSNLPASYYYFFGLFFTAAIFLLIWMRIIKQKNVSGHGTGFTKRGLLYLFTVLLCIVVVTVSFARIVPDIRIPALQTFVATKMLWIQDLEDSFLNLFADVPSKQPLSTSSTREDLVFGHAWKEKEEIDFVVLSPQPSYWRIKVYDTYTSQGWSNRPVTDTLLDRGDRWEDAEAIAGGKTLTYTVTTNIKTDALLTAGNYISSDTSVLVSVIDNDVISVATPRVLSPGEHYTVTSSISSPSSEDLSAVGEGYPESIAYQYLRLPSNFPDKIRLLAENITRDARTPYQKVMAIDDYLSQIPYKEEIKPPPENIDGVEYFLFTQKSGFCLYYASAMVVMLRSVDVPARLAIGYVPGEFGEEDGEYILRDKHYHTWPQAYFTGYDWVDLEATPRSAGSQVSIETPWVSAGTVEEYPQWGVLQPWQIPWIYNWPYELASGEAAAKPVRIRGPLPFADELGRAMLIIFMGAFIIGVLAIPLLVLRSAFYRWLWRVDRTRLASTVYSRICNLASMVGLGPGPQQTPREFAAELTVEFPEQAKALDGIVWAYVENRFGRREGKLGIFEEAEILKARRSVYEGLLKRLGLVRKLFSRYC
ncbi:hypothetical protein ES703_50071 [subsurface metagenome]